MLLSRLRPWVYGAMAVAWMSTPVASPLAFGDEPAVLSLFDVPLLDDAPPSDDLIGNVPVGDGGLDAVPPATQPVSSVNPGVVGTGLVSNDELLRRLEATESRLAELRTQQGTGEPEPSMMAALQDRWQQ